MHEGRQLGRLGVIVAAGLFTVGLTAFAGQTVADSGGNGRGNGNDAGNGRGNGNGNGEGNGNGNGAENRPVDPVVICHVPPGNPDNEHTIEVGSPAVDAHVENHGDATGPLRQHHVDHDVDLISDDDSARVDEHDNDFDDHVFVLDHDDIEQLDVASSRSQRRL